MQKESLVAGGGLGMDSSEDVRAGRKKGHARCEGCFDEVLTRKFTSEVFGNEQKALTGSCACNMHDCAECSAPLVRDETIPSTVHRDDDDDQDDSLTKNALNENIISDDGKDTHTGPKTSNHPLGPIDVPSEPNVTSASGIDVPFASTLDVTCASTL